MLTLKEVEKKYGTFYGNWETIHDLMNLDGKGQRGHGKDHDLLVAGYCLLIAGDNHRLAEMTWCAALLHSFDRFSDNPKKAIDRMLTLVMEHLHANEVTMIRLAVDRHNKPNAEDDSIGQIVLQDADRLANAGPLVIARSGQFQPQIPAIELEYKGMDKNPKGTYREPRSIKDDLLGCLEWESDPRFGLRTPKAKELGKPYFDFLREFFRLTEKQFLEVGL